MNALQDPERRPPVPRKILPASIVSHVPEVEIDLEQVRPARRGAAGGPSGMPADHIKVVLESERDCTSLWRMCQEFASGRMPAEVLQASMALWLAISSIGWSRAPSRNSWDQQSSITRRFSTLHCPPDLGASESPTSIER